MKFGKTKFTLEDVLDGSIPLDGVTLVNRGVVIEKIGICYLDDNIETRFSEHISNENEDKVNELLCDLESLNNKLKITPPADRYMIKMR